MKFTLSLSDERKVVFNTEKGGILDVLNTFQGADLVQATTELIHINDINLPHCFFRTNPYFVTKYPELFIKLLIDEISFLSQEDLTDTCSVETFTSWLKEVYDYYNYIPPTEKQVTTGFNSSILSIIEHIKGSHAEIWLNGEPINIPISLSPDLLMTTTLFLYHEVHNYKYSTGIQIISAEDLSQLKTIQNNYVVSVQKPEKDILSELAEQVEDCTKMSLDDVTRLLHSRNLVDTIQGADQTIHLSINTYNFRSIFTVQGIKNYMQAFDFIDIIPPTGESYTQLNLISKAEASKLNINREISWSVLSDMLEATYDGNFFVYDEISMKQIPICLKRITGVESFGF